MLQSRAKHDQKIIKVLQKTRIDAATRISDSLQGSVWKGMLHDDETRNPQPVVVKVTDQYLQQHSLAQISDTTVRVHENVVSEAKILQFVTNRKQCPNSIVKFHHFFKTKTDYFLVMEDGGSSLFDFVVKAHSMIRSGRIAIPHWMQVAKLIFKQMLECVQYLHSLNICHQDLSLENFVINDVMVNVTQTGAQKDHGESLEFVTKGIQIKLIDFGLAEQFSDHLCLCDKWCGKDNYESPEVLAKDNPFNAKKNDIWCLGVTLFMLTVGHAPWQRASKSDQVYLDMTGGAMKAVLKSWKIWHFVGDELCDLFQSIFQAEAERIGLSAIKQHSWMR